MFLLILPFPHVTAQPLIECDMHRSLYYLQINIGAGFVLSHFSFLTQGKYILSQIFHWKEDTITKLVKLFLWAVFQEIKIIFKVSYQLLL